MTSARGPNDIDAYGVDVYQKSNLIFADGVTMTVKSPSDIKDENGATLIGVARTATLSDFADDAAAASGGVAIGGLYRTASAVMVRVA